MFGMNHSRSQPSYRLPVIGRNRSVEPDQFILDVELPPDRDEREALKEQGRVAKMRLRCRVVRALRGTERAEQPESSPVDDVEEDHAVAA